MEYLLLTTIVGLISFIYYFHIRVQYGSFGKFINKIPGPKAFPIIGNIFLPNISGVDLHSLFRYWGNKYYPVYKLWMGSRATIHIRHPDDVEILLTSTTNLDKDFAYRETREWLKNGLLTTPASLWHAQRKISTPAFHFNMLRKYVTVINEQNNKVLRRSEERGKKFEVNLTEFCSEYTLNIICESTMSVSLDDESNKASGIKYKQGIHDMCRLIVYRTLRPYIKNWMVPFLPTLNKDSEGVSENLKEFVEKIILKRRDYYVNTDYKGLKQLQEDEDSNLDGYQTGTKKQMCLLDLLLAAEKDGLIDAEKIKDEVNTFVFAGHDTTALALCYTIMLLAENDDAQNRAREEVENIFRSKDGDLEILDSQKMNYLDRCIKESLRIFSPIPNITRYMTVDTQFSNFFAPKGSNVICSFEDLHRDPNFWPDPLKFNPDRFLLERCKERHPFAYQPFSAGPRNCIGQKFAMLELKISLAYLLYNFYLKPISYTRNVKFPFHVVLRPDHPVYTKLVRIERR